LIEKFSENGNSNFTFGKILQCQFLCFFFLIFFCLDLRVGNDVEFSVEKRRDKEVAVSVSLLPDGSVIFDDISSELYSGIISILPKKPKKNEQFTGDRNGKIETKIDGEPAALPYLDR